MLMNESRRDYKGRREKMCVFTQGSSLRRRPGGRRGGVGVLCRVTPSCNRWRMWGMLRERRLRPSACSLLPVLMFSAVPAASVCRLSAGALRVNAGRISLSVGRGHWMAAFHGQQKHWLRVRADLRLLRKPGLEFRVDRDSVKICGVYKHGWALKLRQTVLKYMLV